VRVHVRPGGEVSVSEDARYRSGLIRSQRDRGVPRLAERCDALGEVSHRMGGAGLIPPVRLPPRPIRRQ